MASQTPNRLRARVFGRYTASSVVAVVVSELALLTSYGLGALPAVASVIAWAAGAVPNYLLNRHWAWQGRGKASRIRELIPYVVIVVATAAAAAVATTAADAWAHDRIDSHTWQLVLVGAAYLGTYGFMFLLKFVLFDRYVFTGGRGDDTAGTPATRSPS